MRRFLAAAALLAAALLAALWFGLRRDADFAILPPDVPPAPLPVSEEVSRLRLPVSIRIEDLAQAGGMLVPETLSGRELLEGLPVEGEVSATWEAQRGAIAMEQEGPALAARAPVAGSARIRGDVRLPGALGALGSVPVSARIEMAGRIEARATPRLAADWTLEPGLSVAARLDRAEVPLRGLGRVDLAPLLTPGLDRAVEAGLAALRRALADPATLRSLIAPYWESACRTWPLSPTGPWLANRPREIGAAQPVLEDGRLRIAVEIVAATALTDAPDPPADCAPLPERLALFEMPAEGLAEVVVPVTLGWDFLRDALGRSLAAPVAVPGYGTLVIGDLELAAFGTDLLIRADVTGRPEGLFAPRLSGRLWLAASPDFDREAGRLTLSGVRLAQEGASLLTGAAAGLADALIAGLERREIAVDLARMEAEAVRRANREAAALARAMAEAGEYAVTVEEARLLRLSVGGAGLFAEMAMRAALSARDVNLPLLIGLVPR